MHACTILHLKFMHATKKIDISQLERKPPVQNNVNPSNMKCIFKNTKLLTGGLI